MPTILYAEDDHSLREAYAKGLREAGFTVTEAKDGEEAWEIAQTTPFDIVLSDFNMPRLSGTSLLRRLRKDTRYKNTPFFIMSASDDPTAADVAGHLGISWLRKPIDLRELISIIGRSHQA